MGFSKKHRFHDAAPGGFSNLGLRIDADRSYSESPMKDALLATVIDETAVVEAFESLLAFEEKALTAAEPLASLPSIIEKKTALTEQIAQLERVRDEQLSAMGLSSGFAGMNEATASDEALSAQWAVLLEAAGRARRGNNSNGVLIRTRMEYNRKALAAMKVAPSKSGFYGPDGKVPGVMGL
jgi:flagellar biosynthesis protein FlgN